MASLPHVASRRHVASQNLASERGVTDSGGVIEPPGGAGSGVKTWRHWLTWHYIDPPGSDSDDKKMLAVGESSPYVASVRGVRSLRGVRTRRVVKPGGVKTWRQA